ncbi:TPA: GTP pyrophosphokinase [Streptococcus pneumoniae]
MDTSQVIKAHEVAKKAHFGQIDRAGIDYIKHPEAVDILTKKKGQDYQSYLNLVKTNELARVVKLADLRHNSDLTRLPLITEKDLERNKKYSSAIRFLRTKKKS